MRWGGLTSRHCGQSERVGATGPGQEAANGIRDTSAETGPATDAEGDVPPEQRPGQVESNPDGLEPKRTRE